MDREIRKIVEYQNINVLNRAKKSKIEEDTLIKSTIDAVESSTYDFGSTVEKFIYKRGTKRTVRKYDDWTIENILCIYLKRVLERQYTVKYPNRNRYISSLFDIMKSIIQMEEYVIVKFDFKDFFNTLSSKLVIEKVIDPSNLSRRDKDLARNLCNSQPYCYAGLNTSNIFAEILGKMFDERIESELLKDGLIFYERYIDDGIIVLNKYLSSNNCQDKIVQIINKIFTLNGGDCTTCLNMEKYKYITNKNLSQNDTFDFLGYQFKLAQEKIVYGMTEQKIKKYTSQVRKMFLDYKITNDLELLRHKIKLFSIRVVYRIKKYNYLIWKTKGIVSNYCELGYHLTNIDDKTERFLKCVYNDIINELGITNVPYFLKDNPEKSIYNLYNNLERNRSIIFEENYNMGYSKRDLKHICSQIDIEIKQGKSYSKYASEYLIKTGVGY